MKPLFLDTNALIYAFANPDRLPKAWVEPLTDQSRIAMTSTACIWEIAIKRNRLPVHLSVEPNDIVAQCASQRIDILPMTVGDAIGAAQLPLHHKDPFDRMIIWQAISHNALLMTTDRTFASYEVDLLPIK